MQDTFVEMPRRKLNSRVSIAATGSSGLKTADGTLVEDKQPYVEQPASSKIISIDRLYDHSESSSELARALDLLSETKRILEESKANLVNQNLVESDRCIMQFQALLPDLFSCRRLGDGFGNVVNSIMISLVNKRGIPLELKDVVFLC